MENHNEMLKQVESSIEMVVYCQMSPIILKYHNWLIGFNTQDFLKNNLFNSGCTCN